MQLEERLALGARRVQREKVGAFHVLQQKGISSRLVIFPDENHWVLKPQNSVQWHETVLGWIKRWTAE